MEWPDLLPKALHYCYRIRGYELVLTTLSGHSDEDVVLFFETAGADENWVVGHQDLVKEIAQWLSTEYSARRLKHSYARRVVATIHKHPDVLLPLLPDDIVISGSGYLVDGNSLLYGAQSLFFQEVIEKRYAKGKLLVVEIGEVPQDVFRIVEEALTRKIVEGLWRYALKDLRRVIKRAGAWGLDDLIMQTAQVIRRYIDRDNAMEILQIAYDHSLAPLMDQCCHALQAMALGMEFAAEEGTQRLTATVETFRENHVKMLEDVAPIIWGLGLRCHAGSSLECQQLLPRLYRLKGLDLHQSESFNLELLENLPKLERLNLAACAWMDDHTCANILHGQQQVLALDLSENAQLGFETYRAVAGLEQLETLRCVYCDGLTDDFLEFIARDCARMTHIDISWSTALTDQGLQTLGRLRPYLAEINLSHCIKVTNQGIRDLLRPGHEVRKLVMRDLSHVSEDGIIDMVALSPSLTHLDVRGCTISQAGLATLRKLHPQLEVLG